MYKYQEELTEQIVESLSQNGVGFTTKDLQGIVFGNFR